MLQDIQLSLSFLKYDSENKSKNFIQMFLCNFFKNILFSSYCLPVNHFGFIDNHFHVLSFYVSLIDSLFDQNGINEKYSSCKKIAC